MAAINLIKLPRRRVGKYKLGARAKLTRSRLSMYAHGNFCTTDLSAAYRVRQQKPEAI